MKRLTLLLVTFAMLFGLTACAESPSDNPDAALDMQTVYASMKDAVTLPEMLELNDAQMLNFCGIDKKLVKQAVVVICADSLRTDEIWLLEAVDEAAAVEIQTLSDSRLQSKADESITYSPEQYAVVQKAKFIKNGKYIALIVSPDVEALVNTFNQALGI